MRYAARCVNITLVGVAITVSGIAMLIFDFVLGRTWGIVASAAILFIVAIVWVLVPRLAAPRRTDTDTPNRARTSH